VPPHRSRRASIGVAGILLWPAAAEHAVVTALLFKPRGDPTVGVRKLSEYNN